jgi:hypothetical protein
MPQLNLNFTDIPIPQEFLWEDLHNDQKHLIIETFAGLMLKAATASPSLSPGEPTKGAAND